MSELASILQPALEARRPLLDPAHEGAVRLLNGFYEGLPALAVDLYGTTLVLHDYSEAPEGDEKLAREALGVLAAQLPWVRAALWKVRGADDPEARNGRLLLGAPADVAKKVRENGVWYALALTLNRDASLYLDTRNLRAWAKANLAGKKVLNSFAYTGSLGVAARAAPASEVVHVDLNKTFLNVAKDSYFLNGFPVQRIDFRAGDFFEQIGRLKRESALFDCAFLDPPFFSETEKGTIDLQAGFDRVLNKVRPLVGHEGWIVAVNNALFVSGADFKAMLDRVCADGFLSLDSLIPVPEDFTGYPSTRRGAPPADPSPFNHPTKIAVLRVRRKDERRASEIVSS